ncbi:hypothetical protein ACWCP6_33600 [Streptomyces sp. NPDC002004]
MRTKYRGRLVASAAALAAAAILTTPGFAEASTGTVVVDSGSQVLTNPTNGTCYTSLLGSNGYPGAHTITNHTSGNITAYFSKDCSGAPTGAVVIPPGKSDAASNYGSWGWLTVWNSVKVG